ncbi:hypothetical protein BGZ93_000397 [Podila epicladia]|nr:hypothetical protein BGZ92_001000 [Podila epicladia]KAG0085890.1 hypothetical protein BGZ93_000397 [Podila epicladia]
MAKHVYPPWHSQVQKGVFVVAVILCITLPVIYGERKVISSTAVIVVLLLYFGLWAAFSLGMRYGVASYTVESTLPIHTPTPAPPLLLHSPTGRNAVPAAPAIKISSVQYSTSTEEDPEDDDAEYQHKHQLHSQPPSPTAAPPSSPVNFGPPSPRINGVAFAGGGVKFQTRPRGMTSDSTNSDIYPTYATYRQQQHANFDAFAQRIRKALETANAQHRQEQEELLAQQKREAEDKELEQIRLQSLRDESEAQGSGSSSNSGIRQLLPAISATHTRQILEADGAGTSAGAGSNQTLPVSTIKGRPRSSSAASMISNLSEKIRLSSGFFGRSSGVGGTGGRSRAGSDASVLTGPPSLQNLPQQHYNQGKSSTTALPEPQTNSSSGSHEKSSTTTMAALASATAVASAIFMPREAVYQAESEGTGSSGNPRSRRQSRAMTHPLAETANIDDEKQGSSEDEEENNGSVEKGDMVGILDVKSMEPEIVISDHERSLSDDIHVLVSKPTLSLK